MQLLAILIIAALAATATIGRGFPSQGWFF
jgi:hypothetical protein